MSYSHNQRKKAKRRIKKFPYAWYYIASTRRSWPLVTSWNRAERNQEQIWVDKPSRFD